MKTTTLSRAAALVAALAMVLTGFAKTHTVQKGETLESIASVYGITVDQLREANPNASNLFYVGLKLEIPEANAFVNQTETPVATQQGNQTPAGQRTEPASGQNTPSGIEAEDSPYKFTRIFAGYYSPYKPFDEGAYGLGFEIFAHQGYGMLFSAYTNAGIVDRAGVLFHFGPQYGYVLHPMFMVKIGLLGEVATVDEYDYGKGKYTTSVTGGIYTNPGVRVRFERVIIGCDFYFGWQNGYNKMATRLGLSIGYNF